MATSGTWGQTHTLVKQVLKLNWYWGLQEPCSQLRLGDTTAQLSTDMKASVSSLLKMTHCWNGQNWLKKRADDEAHAPESDNTGKLNQPSTQTQAFFVKKSRTSEDKTYCSDCKLQLAWSGINILSEPLYPPGRKFARGRAPSNPGTHGPAATTTWCGKHDCGRCQEGTNGDRERVATRCCALTTGPIGLLVMGFPTNGSFWQVASTFSSNSALALKTQLRFKAFLSIRILESCLGRCWKSFSVQRA